MPVHGLIHARNDNIVSSRHGMAAETKGRTSKSPGHTRRRVKQHKHHAETRDSPPARIPEITWRKPIRHNNSPIVTSKQTTTTPRRNESGEKKSETDSETRANVRKANVKRTVKQPSGCGQSPLSSACPIIILLSSSLLDRHCAQTGSLESCQGLRPTLGH